MTYDFCPAYIFVLCFKKFFANFGMFVCTISYIGQ